MSVISPGMYREMHESDSWEELARERGRLVRRLRRFELHCDELLGDGCAMDPGPDVFYQCELEFLRELCDLTLRAMRRETLGAKGPHLRPPQPQKDRTCGNPCPHVTSSA